VSGVDERTMHEGGNMNYRLLTTILVLLSTCFTTGVAADGGQVFNVPRLENIIVDGKPDDWASCGFRVELMSDPSGKVLPAADFDPKFRLGWNEQGLLAVVTVRDDVAAENADTGSMWTKDAILVFVTLKDGSKEYYGVVIGPGIDPAQPGLRTHFLDHRANRPADRELAAKAARTKSADGYVVELMLPWENLGIQPKRGDEVDCQIIVTDSDEKNDRFAAAWHPNANVQGDPAAMQCLRLARKPSPPVVANATARYEDFRHTRIKLTAVADLAGRTAYAKAGMRRLACNVLDAENGRASADLMFPMPRRGQTLPELAIVVDCTRVASVKLPDADSARARAFIEEKIIFDPYCFSGTELPRGHFQDSLLVEQLIGSYSIGTTYYNALGELVNSADTPGRYAAVMEIKRQDGRVSHRFRTLYKLRQPVGWWRTDLDTSVRLPDELGFDQNLVQEQTRAINFYLKMRFIDGLMTDPRSAALLAGLHDMENEASPAITNALWNDMQWWVTFKRRFYGTDKVYPDPIVCPRTITGAPARVVREGTLAEAGMKPDAADKINAVCEEWVKQSGEPFAVCIVRHGVIVLHKAYGERDGKPMTLTSKSWMASITKLLSATLMMELVDQGLVDPDDRVDKFIPTLRNIKVRTPLTVRHLYTHTNGFWGHWGDEMSDLEEVVADYYPHLQVGARHEYNGVGYAIGGKIIETISGEAVPVFYKNHLLDPLGCTNTDVLGTYGDAYSVPLDIARIGQMLLNRGSYDNMRFFSEETFEKMLPQPLTKLLGPDTPLKWGIGTVWMPGNGWSERTFGHGAASSAIFAIDPVNDLVIVQTRNTAGSEYVKYAPRFIKTIVEQIE